MAGVAQKEWKEYLVVGKEQKPGPALLLSQPLPTAPLPPPYQLQEVMVPMVGNRVCNQRYQNSSTSTGQIIKDDMLDSVQVARIIRHPKYSLEKGAKGGADIALLKLEAPVQPSNLIRWISLPPASSAFPPGTRCWVTGWGNTAFEEPLPPPYNLQEVEVPIVANEICQQQYGYVIQDDLLCAGSWGRGTCNGDSGGPLVCKWRETWVQVGVVSWGKGCGLTNFPGVYARVTSFLPWIRHHIHSSP
ncbi:PREDICTED: mastin-like [Myotis brandtii]|uniref:mastin-like n=1 Tax=Myotis brandtii TaxID=109478 RepID=UPI000703D73B|nr:PREDICTED: mastin-like [Myotis brandtii]